jgi:hypothetical protein
MAITSNYQSHSASLQHPRQILNVPDSSLSRDPSSSTQQDSNQGVDTPQPDTFDSGVRGSLDQHPAFRINGDRLVELESNKRPKSELRGVEGRRSRTIHSHRRAQLKRCSTGSLMNILSLKSNNEDINSGNNEDNNDDENLNDDLPMTPPATKTPAEFEVWCDKEQTPVKKTFPRRAPLTDISLSLGTPTMVRLFMSGCVCANLVFVCVRALKS